MVPTCLRHGGTLPPATSYAVLFGFYLGDGCISRVRATYTLRIFCDEQYGGIVDDVVRQIETVRGRGPVCRVSAPGCVVACAYWNHWPCLFPQHGPGKKHERTLTLEPWQEEIVTAHPAAFLRGLFHSDGCRVRNWATQTVGGERRRYEYARWQFVNHSTDIRGFCTRALDLLGSAHQVTGGWRQRSGQFPCRLSPVLEQARIRHASRVSSCGTPAPPR